jgi:hypothetical protein
MNQKQVAHIEDLMAHLSLDEQLVLFERLSRQLRASINQTKEPTDLYGVWEGRFPVEFDIDVALSEIRQEWQSQAIE